MEIEIPPDKLLPTLPLRLNYILWIEDLLKHSDIKDEIIGIDIGTGACCIYCLLALRMNDNWRMFGLEIDKENVKYAASNVLRNKLEQKITVIDQEGSDRIFEKLFNAYDNKKTFTICNPPFFSSKEELTVGENRTGKRKRLDQQSPLRESCETVFNDGGEYGFVSKIFTESMKLRDKIEIYSTMFGCKKNFQKFIKLLKDNEIVNHTTTEFIQGKVCRWAIAWSFTKNLCDFKNKPQVLDNSINVLKHVIKNMNLEDVHDKVMKIFTDLKISAKCIKGEVNKLHQYELEAHSNTWSNQRRKRRAEQRNKSLQNNEMSTSNQFLRMGFEINTTSDDTINLQIFFIDGTMAKDSVNQVLQYIKNNIKPS